MKFQPLLPNPGKSSRPFSWQFREPRPCILKGCCRLTLFKTPLIKKHLGEAPLAGWERQKHPLELQPHQPSIPPQPDMGLCILIFELYFNISPSFAPFSLKVLKGTIPTCVHSHFSLSFFPWTSLLPNLQLWAFGIPKLSMKLFFLQGAEEGLPLFLS